ncbi:hypothetical protein EB796_006256 [Bugula neritina]|uniref:Uncharacterized protein n=1 Tax=Bugula neritina TaxID=10212 RepID=A0A7J7KD21_BUGNE|nr:hypothetical protein EB796_006256 [Bugula neritina]
MTSLDMSPTMTSLDMFRTSILTYYIKMYLITWSKCKKKMFLPARLTKEFGISSAKEYRFAPSSKFEG